MVVLHKKKKTTLLSFWKCRNPKLHPRPVEMSSTVWFLSAKMYLSQRDQLPCRSDTNRHNKTPIIRSCKHKPNRTTDWTEGHSAGLHHTKCLSAYTWASKLHVTMSARLKSKFQKLERHGQIMRWKVDLPPYDVISANQCINGKKRVHGKQKGTI